MNLFGAVDKRRVTIVNEKALVEEFRRNLHRVAREAALADPRVGPTDDVCITLTDIPFNVVITIKP